MNRICGHIKLKKQVKILMIAPSKGAFLLTKTFIIKRIKKIKNTHLCL